MVIVVIGLLVGAISATRNFMSNAQLNSLVNESKYYVNAFQQFGQLNTTRHAIPGDFAQAKTIWPAAVDNGDGNGLIRAAATAQNCELFGAFQHLALAGLIRGSFTGKSADGTSGASATKQAGIGKNIPQSVMDRVGYYFDHPDALDGNVSGDGVYFDGKYGHVLIVAGATTSAMPDTAFLTPMQTMKIDDKYDDGAPGKGWIRVPNTTAATCALDSITYNTTVDDNLCYLIYNIQ